MKKRTAVFLSTAFGLITTTILVTFLAKGFVVDLSSKKKIKKTGMILAQSTPAEAKVYLDGKLVETTNAVLESLNPGPHNLKIEREGFCSWSKEIQVYKGLITEVNALLIPTSPPLNPLTRTGIEIAQASPTGEKIAYTSRESTPQGVWILDLAPSALLSAIQENPKIIAKDTSKRKYSLAENLTWDPKEQELLITLNPQGHILTELKNGTNMEATTSAKPTLQNWAIDEKALKEKWSKRIFLPKSMEKVAVASDTIWSPDRKRFLYKEERGDYKEWHVFNGEKPLGVGHKRNYTPVKFKKDVPAKVSWHSTSNHLIIEEENSISMAAIDGTNKKVVYSGKLEAFQTTPTPDGANLIILTSFRENEPPNLYMIGLR